MAKKETIEFLNPFNNGVNYKMFLDAMGSIKLEDYCKEHLTKEQIDFLIEDLKHYKK